MVINMPGRIRTFILSWMATLTQVGLMYLWCAKGMDTAGGLIQVLAGLSLFFGLIAAFDRNPREAAPPIRVIYLRRMLLIGNSLAAALFGHTWTATAMVLGYALLWSHQFRIEEAYRGNQAH
jgi:hypothetical protein